MQWTLLSNSSAFFAIIYFIYYSVNLIQSEIITADSISITISFDNIAFFFFLDNGDHTSDLKTTGSSIFLCIACSSSILIRKNSQMYSFHFGSFNSFQIFCILLKIFLYPIIFLSLKSSAKSVLDRKTHERPSVYHV